jgi:hypothetical protein
MFGLTRSRPGIVRLNAVEAGLDRQTDVIRRQSSRPISLMDLSFTDTCDRVKDGEFVVEAGAAW